MNTGDIICVEFDTTSICICLQDSHGSDVELTTFTARNTNSSIPTSEKQPEPQQQQQEDEEEEEEETSALTEPLVIKENGVTSQQPVTSSSSSEDEEEEEEVESPPANSGPEQSLLSTSRYSKSQASIDSYDIDKNPFFDDWWGFVV